MNRRAFLGGTVGAALAVLGVRHWLEPSGETITPSKPVVPSPPPRDSMLNHPASECPIDTVVVVMMENRSFDHYLGWLADDPAYLEAGRRRYGPGFSINGRVRQTFLDSSGRRVSTRPAGSDGSVEVETRGCTYRNPGHSWEAARRQRDHGFLAPGTGNDEFALTYYSPEDLPVYAAMARRFTVFDRWHSSLLGPTFPNRQYLLSAQSEGLKGDPGLATELAPLDTGIFHAPTIIERLAGAGVSSRYYYTNIPLIALWGTDRMAPFIHSLDRYFDDAAAGRLPRVAFVEPRFGGGDAYRTDDHPRGDIRLGQRWVREVFRAFVQSPHWSTGAFVLTYDEGGGFFDHVAPPLFADVRASTDDQDNFGQGGFRVPTLLASPYARPGGVDHRGYDHTAVMRFLEWRFLGAPPEGSGSGRNWFLTVRDRNAQNMGATLRPTHPDPELGFDLSMAIPPPSPGCTPSQLASHPPDHAPDPFDHPEIRDLGRTRFPDASHEPWLADVKVPLG
jgi:phospholipase C